MKKNIALILVMVMLISMFSAITISAYNPGDSFRIYSNINYDGNTAGRGGLSLRTVLT